MQNTRSEIPLGRVFDNPWQSRPIDHDHVEDMAVNIQQNGLLQPPVGRIINLARFPTDTEFVVQIAFGHHRLAAFRLLRETHPDDETWSTIPVEIRDLTDEQMAMFGWSENEQRGDLSEIQKALAIQRYIVDFGWTQEQAAQKVGLSRSTVANKLRVLKLKDSELTRPVYDALEAGTISERQAMPALDLLAQPAELIERAEANTYNKPSALVKKILTGETSSDNLRQQVESVIAMAMDTLTQDRRFLEYAFSGEEYQSPRCQDCKFNMPSKQYEGRRVCARPSCYERKSKVWEEQQAAEIMRATGLELLPENTPAGAYRSFWGEDKTAIEHVLETKSCENLRLRKNNWGDGGYYTVCLHGEGKRCTCLAAELKRRKQEDPAEVAAAAARKQSRVLANQAIEAFAQALLAGNQQAWYMLARREHYDLKEHKITEETSVLDIIQFLAGYVVKNKAPEEFYGEAEKTKKLIDELLAQIGAKADGSQLTPAGSAWAKFQRIQGWIKDLPREFPTVEMVRGNLANLDKLIDTTGLEMWQWKEIAQARDLLETLLPIVESWKVEDTFSQVRTLVFMPEGSDDFRRGKEKWTARVIQYALLFIPKEGNQSRIATLEKQLKKLTPKTLAEVFAEAEQDASVEVEL